MLMNTMGLAHVYSCIFQQIQRLSQLGNIDLKNMKRYWTNLSKNEPIFVFLPIETLVIAKQQDYLRAFKILLRQLPVKI